MDINFPERFLLFSPLEPGSSLSFFRHFCGCFYHCSLFAFVLTEQTLKGDFVKMSPATSVAQDGFSFLLLFLFFIYLFIYFLAAPALSGSTQDLYGTWNLVP